jgi:hypothetical protein
MNYKIKQRILFLPLILILILNVESNAQFNSLIFKKSFYLSPNNNNTIQSLGDQNADGYDDFLIYDCSEKKSYIFFGGNPVDTIPKFAIASNTSPVAILDLNDDHIKDIVMYDNINKKIKVFYGGKLIDTIPDLIFNPPLGVSNNFGGGIVIKDFNGDGRSELVLYDPNIPYSGKQFGSFYFYNTGSTFDTIPHYAIYGDSVNSIYYDASNGIGDLNGDGKTDFAVSGYQGNFHNFMCFYLGNSEWNLTPAVIYYQEEHLFNVKQMFVTKDLNKDGRDDIIMEDYGFYPYYYSDVVLKGNFPIDTIPAFGLNTQNEGIGVHVTSLGDVNGDGFNDFISQTYNPTPNLKLWLGGRKIHAIADKTWYGTDPGGFGRIYGAVGDVNGDGLADIGIGEVTFGIPFDCKLSSIYIFNGDSTVHADTITSVINDNVVQPQKFKLNNPYPNPFNPSIIIGWQSSIKGRVRIKVFDILGREVGLLLDEERQSGSNKIEFDASKYKLTSGVYLLQVDVFDNGRIVFEDNKKLNYIK